MEDDEATSQVEWTWVKTIWTVRWIGDLDESVPDPRLLIDRNQEGVVAHETELLEERAADFVSKPDRLDRPRVIIFGMQIQAHMKGVGISRRSDRTENQKG